MEDDILLQILKEDPDIEDAEERYRQFVADDEVKRAVFTFRPVSAVIAEARRNGSPDCTA